MEISGKPPLLFAPSTLTHFIDDVQGGVASKTDESHDKDTIDLSTNANEKKEMVKKVNQLPDVREEKVAELKRRIESGTYAIMSEKTASHLIGEAVENNAILNRIDDNDD
jgi:negative regulator of flagellin synthesis FlgM